MKYKQYNIEPVFTQYSFGGNLALYFTEENESMFGVITVNLEDDDPTNECCAFIDINTQLDMCHWVPPFHGLTHTIHGIQPPHI
jgi:hypothetical protein